ncbi:MAG: 30S ribosomal protein S2 [Halobacteriovoraceae bacterium]|nr:30S ribosomal protein S2 [Halobacteriovoraceae bacterium]
MSKLEVKDLLKAGVHFGHQTEKWNPKMKKYVYGEKNGIYIIDVTKSVDLAAKAYNFLKKVSAEGKSVLFVGTKRQAGDVIKKAAEDCGAFYVTNRWLGGMLTNYKTIALSIDKLRKVEKMKETGDFSLLTKKEQSKINKEIDKLEKNLGGIKNMRKLPGALFIVDPNAERIAVAEAKHLGIPVVAITDTNCDPENIDYVVPGNDDAIKSITLFTDYFGGAVSEGSANIVKKSDSDSADRDISLEKEILAKYEKDIELKEEFADVTEDTEESEESTEE